MGGGGGGGGGLVVIISSLTLMACMVGMIGATGTYTIIFLLIML